MVAVYYYYLLPFVFPAILSSVLGLSSQDHQSQLYEAKLRITQSESRLEEITQNINDRDLYLEKSESLIGELDHKLNHLQSVFSLLKAADDKIKGLEEEVRVLWATLRKNNFDIHVLESKAREAEDRLEMITSQAEKVNPLYYCWFICFCSLQMEDIVSERWIQIQHFEQALQLKEMRLKAQRQARPSRWTFLKLFSYLSGEHLPNAHGLFSSHFSEESALRAYESQTFSWLKRFYSTVKESHHEVLMPESILLYHFSGNMGNGVFASYSLHGSLYMPPLSFPPCFFWVLKFKDGDDLALYSQTVCICSLGTSYPNLNLILESVVNEAMEDTTWEQRLQALTHLLTSPTTTPPLYSQFFISTQIPCYLKWDYPPILCAKDTKTFPSLLLRWGFSLFLKRTSRFGCPETSWRSKCPYQQPPPLILAKGLEEAQWGDEQRIEHVRKRLRRKKLVSNVNPFIPILVPNLLLFSLLLWNPFPDHDS
ncbi:hypothetical protein DKX38_005590 [Salix brachista]|uniref:Uncharacterized protein n=1 Tax=Salix brachista TaxID=2182728 RepID=A0A5N5N203_9ROSI|nr:hypothetical protein DKX38_005590 [Salix brachista]